MKALLMILHSSCGILLAQGNNFHRGGSWWGHGYSGIGGILMWLIPIVLVGILVYSLVHRNDSARRDDPRETPLEILKKRYAKGEISREEFERMRREIN